MEFQHPRGAGPLMEPIHVLGDHYQASKKLFQVSNGPVGGVRLGRLGLFPAHLVKAPDEKGIPGKGLRGCHLFNPVAFPQPTGSAKGGQPTFRGNPGARKHHQLPALAKQSGRLTNQFHA
jgi:hypothetical protein